MAVPARPIAGRRRRRAARRPGRRRARRCACAGVNLAIVTLASAVAVEHLVFKNPSRQRPARRRAGRPADWSSAQGSARTTPGSDRRRQAPQPAVRRCFCLVVAVVLVLVVANLRRSTTGRQMLAVRSNERAAAAAGVSVARHQAARVRRCGVHRRARRRGLGLPLRRRSPPDVRQPRIAQLPRLRLPRRHLQRDRGDRRRHARRRAGCCGRSLRSTVVRRRPPTSRSLLGGLGLIVAAVVHPEGVAGAAARASSAPARRAGRRRRRRRR